MSQQAFEKVGTHFDREKFLQVQRESFEALYRIAKRVEVGMREEDAYELAKTMLTEMGFGKSWHRPYVRFGVNTTLMYGGKSQPDVRLGENDIFYLDIGPVKDGLEGDVGETFLTGADPEKERCIADSKLLFKECLARWRGDGLSGRQLYAFAQDWAGKRGWGFNKDWNGHRISEFPHHAHHKGALAEVDFTPSGGLWILEIHLCDAQGRFGAFFEDVLV